MSFELPVPFLAAILVFAGFVVIATRVGGFWAFGFLGAAVVVANVRNWHKTHEPRAQQLADGAHLFGGIAGIALLLGLSPTGIWQPLALFGPVTVASSLAAVYANLNRRRSSATAHEAAVFQAAAGSGADG